MSSATPFLPVELQERAIDACYDPTIAVSQTYSTWRACALTCKALRPRSRYNIFHEVELLSAAQVDLFLRAIADDPFLVDLVFQVSSLGVTRHIPFARPPIPHLLRRCQVLRFDLSTKLYPPNYIHSIALFSQLTDLVVTIQGHSTSTFLHLVWSFPKLRAVTIRGITTQCGVPVSQAYNEKLTEMRRLSACRELKYIEFSNPSAVVNWPHLPMPRVFGDAITCVTLTLPEELHPVHENTHMFISALPLLEALSLKIATVDPSYHSAPIQSPEQTWESCICGIVSHIRSRAFQTLHIDRAHIEPPHSPTMERWEIKDMLSGGALRDALKNAPNVRNISVIVWENNDQWRDYWDFQNSSLLWLHLRQILKMSVMVTASGSPGQWILYPTFYSRSLTRDVTARRRRYVKHQNIADKRAN